jgi:hypothetical protein
MRWANSRRFLFLILPSIAVAVLFILLVLHYSAPASSPTAYSGQTLSTLSQPPPGSVAGSRSTPFISPAPTTVLTVNVSRARAVAYAGRSLLNDCQSAVQIFDVSGNLANVWKSKAHVYYDYDIAGFEFTTPPPLQCTTPGSSPPFVPGPLRLSLIPGADPTTFEVIDQIYAKDTKYVYMIENPREVGSPDHQVIEDADPETFSLIVDSNSPTGYSNVYTKDSTHVFAFGEIIQSADPKTFKTLSSVQASLCSYTAEDANHYYNGEFVRDECQTPPGTTP